MSSEESRKRQRVAEDNADDVQIAADEKRRTLPKSHKIVRDETGKHHLLLLMTGACEVSKIPELLAEIEHKCGKERVIVKVVATERAARFFESLELPYEGIVYEDKDEWAMLREKGNPVLHIELQKWADSALIAPLDANTLGKISHGISDNIVLSIIRAWDLSKPCYFAPAMGMNMWENPLTLQHRTMLKSTLKFKEICPVRGDEGQGAMASVGTISSLIAAMVRDQLAVRSLN